MKKEIDEKKVAKLRLNFPILNKKVNNRPLNYLDYAATTHKPLKVINRINNFYANENSNIHRGVHRLSIEATNSYESARAKVSDFLGAKTQNEIVFVRGATEAINLVSKSFLEPNIKPNEEIIVTAMEHHANIVPWQILSEKTGAKIRVVHLLKDGSLDIEHFSKLINKKTKLVACAHVSNATGIINPIKKITSICREHQIPVLVDGAQGVAHINVDVQDLGCDFYVLSGHKMYGPTGIGVLWGEKKHLDAMPPWQGGGDMIKNVSFEKTTFNEAPYKFEAGTPNISGALGLVSAIEFLEEIGFSWIDSYEKNILNLLTSRLRSIEGITIYGSNKNKIPIASFNLKNTPASDIGMILDQQGIAVRVGHHCAEPLMSYLKISGTVRASCSFLTTEEEINSLVFGINKAKKMLL